MVPLPLVELAPLVLPLLFSGLGTSLGLTYAARSRRLEAERIEHEQLVTADADHLAGTVAVNIGTVQLAFGTMRHERPFGVGYQALPCGSRS